MKTKYCSYKWSDEEDVTNSRYSLMQNLSEDIVNRGYKYLHFSTNILNFPNIANTTGITLRYLKKGVSV